MEEKRKKIDWSLWKKKCPACSSSNIEAQNTFKRGYFNTRSGWKLKELQLIICKECGKKFWR